VLVRRHDGARRAIAGGDHRIAVVRVRLPFERPGRVV
jgi:hypothetical protein